MSSPAIGRGPDLAVINRLAALLGSHFDEEQRVYPLGARDIGGNQSVIVFRASRACQFVRVHVQNSGQVSASPIGLFTRGLARHETKGLYARGLGIGDARSSYIAGSASSTTDIDCRSERQQQSTVSRDGTNAYIAWVIPRFLEVDGSFTLFDGVDAEDRMCFFDLGV